MQTEPIYALYVDYSNNSDCGKVLVSLSNTSTDRHTKLKLALKHTVCGSQTHAKTFDWYHPGTMHRAFIYRFDH